MADLAVEDFMRVTREALVKDVLEELDRAQLRHQRFHSAHEGYAVILEELDELWEEVRKKRSAREPKEMREECIQIAAMALRFALELT